MKSILLSALALILFGAYGTVSDIRNAPKVAVQQYVLAPQDQPFQVLTPKNPVTRSFTMPTPWVKIAIRYVPASFSPKERITFEIQHLGKTIHTTTDIEHVIQSSPDGTDFFTNNHWFFISLPPLPTEQPLTLQLTTDNGSIQIPNENIVGLVRTSLLDRFQWSLTHNNRIGLLINITLGIVTLFTLWELGRLGTTTKTSRIALFLLPLFALWIALPLFATTTHWGQNDWAEVTAHFVAARHAFHAGQFPLWNPYFCGGFPAWSNPQTYWSSLVFLITTISGDIIGTKIAIVIYLSIGMLGMYASGRALRLSPLPAALAAILFFGNGFMSAHIGYGHLMWLTAAYIPWTLFFFVKSITTPRYIIASALCTVFIFIEGQVYFTAYTGLFIIVFALARYIDTKQRIFLKHLVIYCILVAGLGAWKIIPTLVFTNTFTGTFGAAPHIPMNLWYDAFLTQGSPDTTSTHEQYAYIGLLPFILCIMGIIRAVRQRNYTYGGIAFATLLFLAITTIPQKTNPLFQIPFLSFLRSPTRALIGVMLGSSILAAFGLQTVVQLVQNKRWRHTVALGGLVGIAITYIIAARPFMNHLFSLDPLGIPSATPFSQTASRTDTTYHLTTAGIGNASYCPPHLRLWQPKDAVLTTDSPLYKGEVYTDNATPVRLTHFTPNKLTLTTGTVSKHDTIHINQNYTAGWHASHGNVQNNKSHIAVAITPADSNAIITLTYTPPGLWIGLAITCLTFFALLRYYS